MSNNDLQINSGNFTQMFLSLDPIEQMQHLIECRNLLELPNNASNKSTQITTLWAELNRHLTTASAIGVREPLIRALAFTIDYFIEHINSSDLSSKLHPLLLSAFHQHHQLNEILTQKYVIFILRRMHEQESAEWRKFFLIIDTAAEKQIHLVLPILHLLPEISGLPSGWYCALLAHLLKNVRHQLVLTSIVESSMPLIGQPSNTILESFWMQLFVAMNSANSSSIEMFCTCFNRFGTDGAMMNIISEIAWKPVPLYHLFKAVKRTWNIIPISFKCQFERQGKATQNVWIRDVLYDELCATGRSAETHRLLQQWKDVFDFEQFYFNMLVDLPVVESFHLYDIKIESFETMNAAELMSKNDLPFILKCSPFNESISVMQKSCQTLKIGKEPLSHKEFEETLKLDDRPLREAIELISVIII